MSGGHFDYACFMVENDEDMLKAIPYLKGMEEYCRKEGKHGAADIVMNYRLFMETHQRQMLVYGEKIAGLLRNIEWTASGDTGLDAIDYGVEQFMGIPAPIDK